MSKPIITKQMLIDAGACRDQVELFAKKFGDSVVVTVIRAKKVAHLFGWDWAVQLLDGQGRVEYERVTATALAEYKRVQAPALAEYKRVQAPALAEYERVQATAWASAFIDMHKRGASA